MTHALSQLYIGPLASFSPPRITTTAPGADTLSARKLLDPPRLTALLDRFGTRYRHGDRRAIASLWSKWHFSTLFVHSLATNLLFERDLPLGLHELHLIQSSDGQTAGLELAHAGKPLADLDPVSRFTTLLDHHLTPLIQALADTTGASPKVFWSNAGNYFEYFANALTHHPMAAPDTGAPARALMACRTLPDGRRNPLFQPVRYVTPTPPDRPARVRRMCCIRYLIDDLGYCANCPLACRRGARQATPEGTKAAPAGA